METTDECYIRQWQHRAANFPAGSVPPPLTPYPSTAAPRAWVTIVKDQLSVPMGALAYAGHFGIVGPPAQGQEHLYSDTFPNCPAGAWAYDIYALIRAEEDFQHAPRAFFSFTNGNTQIIKLTATDKGTYNLGGNNLPGSLEYTPPKHSGTSNYVWKIVTCHLYHLNQRLYQGVTLKASNAASWASVGVINQLHVGSVPTNQDVGSLMREVLYMRAYRNAAPHSDAVREANVYSIANSAHDGSSLYECNRAANDGHELFD